MVKPFSALLSSALFMTTGAVNAADVNINGFLSVGGGQLSNDKIEEGFAGYDDKTSFIPDGIIGIQLSSQINDKTSATAQLVSRGTADYDTEAAWAYITYQLTDDLSAKVGRIRTPLFYYSDFLEVGYAYNWIRPSPLVYRFDFGSSLDGVDLTKSFSIGNAEGSIQAYYGRLSGVDLEFTDTISVEGDTTDFTGIALNLSNGNLNGRLSYHQADFSSELTNPALVTVDPSFAIFNAEEESVTFYEAALVYDDGNWFAMGEWTSFETNLRYDLDDTAYLLSAGKRFNDVMVHATYAKQEEDSEPGRLFTDDTERQTMALGIRYDYDAGTAFKFEIEQLDVDLGDQQNPLLPSTDDSTVLYSFAIDVVF